MIPDVMVLYVSHSHGLPPSSVDLRAIHDAHEWA